MIRRQNIAQAPASATNQRGFAIVSAIFLLIVLTLLGAFMVSMSVMQTGTVSLASTSSRVYLGAKSGLEWGIHQAVAPAVSLGACNASTPFALSGPGLSGVSVTVTCSSTILTGLTDYYIYSLTSTARFGSLDSPDYAERKLSATVCRSNKTTTAEC